MNTTDYIVIAVLTLIIGSAIFCICKAKKKGVKCIGCPDSGNCSGNCANCHKRTGS